jgi:hypothetical protein
MLNTRQGAETKHYCLPRLTVSSGEAKVRELPLQLADLTNVQLK